MNKIIISIIFSLVANYIASQCDTQMWDIYTPLGSPVETWAMCESSTAVRLARDNNVSSSYPNATKMITYDNLSSTDKFNCHGYAWLRVEQGIDRWIGYWRTTDEDIYMSDGSYVPVSQATYPGKVSWTSDNHSAVTTGTSGYVISKWGSGPLMRHQVNYSPYNGSVQYYVKRDFTISGPDIICPGTSSVFTATNIPSSIAYSWDKSSNLTLVSTSGNSATFSASSNGSGWISIKVNNVEIRKKILSIGTTTNWSASLSVWDSTWTGVASGISGIQSFEWVVSGSGWNIVEDTYYPVPMSHVSFIPLSSFATSPATVTVRAKSCNQWGAFVSVGSVVYYTGFETHYAPAYPNPANSVLSLDIGASVVQAKTLANKIPLFDLRLYDQTGVLVRTVTSRGVGNMQIDVSSLPNGIYYLHISDNNTKKVQSQTVIVKH